jgi:hypothetical protein
MAAEVVPTAVMEAAASAAPAAAATAVETAATTAAQTGAAAVEATAPLLETATETASNAGANAADAAGEVASALGGPAAEAIPEPSAPIGDAADLEQRVAEVRDVVSANEAAGDNSGSSEAPAEAASDQPAEAAGEATAPTEGEATTTAGEAPVAGEAPAAAAEPATDTKTQTKAEGDNNKTGKPETTENSEQQTAESQVYIPKGLREDPEFQRKLGEAVANANADGNTNLNAITKKVLDEHYANWAKDQASNPLPIDIQSNDIYQALLSREVTILPAGADQLVAMINALAAWKYLDEMQKDATAESNTKKKDSIYKLILKIILSTVIGTVVGGANQGAKESGLTQKK